jgi:hypothetical protein
VRRFADMPPGFAAPRIAANCEPDLFELLQIHYSIAHIVDRQGIHHTQRQPQQFTKATTAVLFRRNDDIRVRLSGGRILPGQP